MCTATVKKLTNTRLFHRDGEIQIIFTGRKNILFFAYSEISFFYTILISHGIKAGVFWIDALS